MGTHNCQGCGFRCSCVHPLCMWCRQNQRVRVETFAQRAEAALASEGDSERISPVIVRQVDAILARHNRQEARSRRRLRKADRIVIYLGWSILGALLCIGAFALGATR
jgi:hypothetical protein